MTLTMKSQHMIVLWASVMMSQPSLAPGDVSVTRLPSSQKLLVVLLDGFRWDYVEKFGLLNFQRLQVLGARAGYVINDFPTLSYPNYYTIMTGLHTESHGMTDNYMYASARQEYFLIGTNPEQLNSHWWDGGEPLWVTAVRQNRQAYMYHWPGCEVTIHKTRPTFCQDYKNVPILADFRSALQAATHQLIGVANLAAVYHENPDYVGHKFGPNSSQMMDTLQGIDAELGRLLDQLVRFNMQHQVNLVIMSDHGMTSIDSDRSINLTTVLADTDLYTTILGIGAITSIYTRDQRRADQVYALLKDFSPRMQVYKSKDIPDRYRYRHGKYVADVICVADLGWVITQPLSPGFPQKDGKDLRGFHGYDNTETDMRGIFFAYGPYFHPGAEVTKIQAVDPYNLMCDILAIHPAPNNGSRQRLLPLLTTSAGPPQTLASLLVVLANVLLAVTLVKP